MQEAKDPKSTSNEAAEGDAGDAAQSRDPEATSSETLSDIEEKEKVADKGDNDSPSGAPSPDGAFDEPRGGRDDAGPM